MKTVEILPLDGFDNVQTESNSYLIKNNASGTAALINPMVAQFPATRKTIEQVKALVGQIEWIFLTQRPSSLDGIKALQTECGGIIAGSELALKTFESELENSRCQFALLSDKQLLLLGHIDLLVSLEGRDGEVSYLIENNAFTKACSEPMKNQDNVRLQRLSGSADISYFFV